MTLPMRPELLWPLSIEDECDEEDPVPGAAINAPCIEVNSKSSEITRVQEDRGTDESKHHRQELRDKLDNLLMVRLD